MVSTKEAHADVCSGRLLKGGLLHVLGSFVRFWTCSYCLTTVVLRDDDHS
jgi:hypothetical protein